MKKGDLFRIDVDAFCTEKKSYFQEHIPNIVSLIETNAESLRNKIFKVHRIEDHGRTIIYDTGNGFTGIKREFVLTYK